MMSNEDIQLFLSMKGGYGDKAVIHDDGSMAIDPRAVGLPWVNLLWWIQYSFFRTGSYYRMPGETIYIPAIVDMTNVNPQGATATGRIAGHDNKLEK